MKLTLREKSRENDTRVRYERPTVSIAIKMTNNKSTMRTLRLIKSISYIGVPLQAVLFVDRVALKSHDSCSNGTSEPFNGRDSMIPFDCECLRHVPSIIDSVK